MAPLPDNRGISPLFLSQSSLPPSFRSWGDTSAWAIDITHGVDPPLSRAPRQEFFEYFKCSLWPTRPGKHADLRGYALQSDTLLYSRSFQISTPLGVPLGLNVGHPLLSEHEALPNRSGVSDALAKLQVSAPEDALTHSQGGSGSVPSPQSSMLP